ncbi:GGDEF domain-containing protein [Aestuariibius sp. 2305UL40-4]|uniref:GGDEF domain-containing protein n=1 Tax=Aestuariibius violaceus TaxID=3234132 RepID=UPI00345E96A5
MMRLITAIAPKTAFQWVWKPVFWLVLVNLSNLGVEYAVSGGWAGTVKANLIVGSIVATPFTLLSLWLISRLTQLNGQYDEMAKIDLLTGLPNRRAFFAKVEAAAERECGVLLMLDLDHFKGVNDTYGHAAGDACLRAVAGRMRDITREEDVVGRLGGEEFGIYLAGAPVHVAGAIGKRLSHGVAVAAEEAGAEFAVTISIGACEWQRGFAVEEVMRQADKALYEAKASGRARFVLATPHHSADAA